MDLIQEGGPFWVGGHDYPAFEYETDNHVATEKPLRDLWLLECSYLGDFPYVSKAELIIKTDVSVLQSTNISCTLQRNTHALISLIAPLCT